MNCIEAQQLISSYLDGELAKAERETLQHHLSLCSLCQEQMESYQTLNRQMNLFFETRQQETSNQLSQFHFSFPSIKTTPAPHPISAGTYLASGMVLGTVVTLFLVWLLTLKPYINQIIKQNEHIMGLQKQISQLQNQFKHSPSPYFFHPEPGAKMEKVLVQILKKEPSMPAKIFVLSAPQKEKWQRWSRLQALVGCLEDPSPHVRIAVARKLKNITKEDLGYTADFWKEGKKLDEAKEKWIKWCENLARKDGEFIFELGGAK